MRCWEREFGRGLLAALRLTNCAAASMFLHSILKMANLVEPNASSNCTSQMTTTKHLTLWLTTLKMESYL